MKNYFGKSNRKATVLKIFVASTLISGCSNTIPESEENKSFALLPADEMKEGSGIFSGEKGEFYIIGGDKKVKETTEKDQVSVKDLNLNQTSKVLDERIKKLEKDQQELELLKQQIDKKLQAQ